MTEVIPGRYYLTDEEIICKVGKDNFSYNNKALGVGYIYTNWNCTEGNTPQEITFSIFCKYFLYRDDRYFTSDTKEFIKDFLTWWIQNKTTSI